MASAQRDISDTLTGDETVSLTLRLKVTTHEKLEAVKAAGGPSLNSQINKMCEDALTPGGAAQIAAQRRRLTPRGRPGPGARAALAYTLGYLGYGRDARRAWPWNGRFAVPEGDPEHLALAGALLACEIDLTKGN